MKKYYIEIAYEHGGDNYAMQSDWFDTKEEAVEWAKKIVWVGDMWDLWLMSAIFDEKGIVDDYIKEERLG